MRRELFVCTLLAVALHAGALFGVRVGTSAVALPVGDESSVEVTLVANSSNDSVEAFGEPLPPVAEANDQFPTPAERQAPELPPPTETAVAEPGSEPPPPLPPRDEPRAMPMPNVASTHAHPVRSNSRTPKKGGSNSAATMARPRYRSNPPPDYPPDARRRRQEGTTIVEVEVTTEGRASRVTIERSAGFSALDQAALSAVRRWTFEPGRVGGLPVSSRVQIPVRFKLSD